MLDTRTFLCACTPHRLGRTYSMVAAPAGRIRRPLAFVRRDPPAGSEAAAAGFI